MVERPILFSGPMVRAILDGRKTQTRRVIGNPLQDALNHPEIDPRDLYKYCPFGAPGDRLWCRETLRQAKSGEWQYDADKKPVLVSPDDETAMIVWAHHNERDYCPSIHMPRWASRTTLEITAVRVERLQEISEEDAKAEGISYAEAMEMGDSYPAGFMALWHKIHAAYGPNGWAADPWVWVIEFKRLEADNATR